MADTTLDTLTHKLTFISNSNSIKLVFHFTYEPGETGKLASCFSRCSYVRPIFRHKSPDLRA